MGSSTSHHGRHPRPKRTLKRTISAIFICSSSSSTAPIEMEDDSTEDCHDPDNTAKLQRRRKKFALPSSEYRFTSAKSETAASSQSSVVLNETPSPEDGAGTRADCSSRGASALYEDKPFSDPSSSSERVNMSLVDGSDDIIERVTQPNSQSPQVYEFHERVPLSQSSEPGSINDTSQETIPSLAGLLETGRGQEHRDEVVQHDELVDISSGNSSNPVTEINIRELRRDGRRLFWDAFSRRSSRRHSYSQTSSFSPHDSGSHDRWLLDFGGDSLDGMARDDNRYLGDLMHNITRGRRHSRSEIGERIRGGLDGIDHRTDRCPSGLHPDGSCSCESILMAQDTRPHASISRMAMLAEALFDVLDEIHRQPVSVSLPMVLLPAPESVVDSLPVKIYRNKHKINNDLEQCHICLAEYEEEDQIRVLPCQHEFHTSCVDKWLKETHRVCPLCRGDVCGVSNQ